MKPSLKKGQMNVTRVKFSNPRVAVQFALAILGILGFSTIGYSQLPGNPKNGAEIIKKANDYVVKGSEGNNFTNANVIVDKDFDDIENFQYYESALILWQKALESDTNNAYLNYNVGLCYFFSYDKQLKAIPYLRKAIKDMSEDWDFRNTKETKAPYKALYFLAETFLENNMADSAISYFTLYQDQNDKHSLNFNTDKGLSNSINVKFADKKPVPFKVTNLGENINSKYAETNPVVDDANTTIYFSSRRPGSSATMDPKLKNSPYIINSDIYISTKDSSGKWGEPKAFAFNTPYDEAPVFITKDGLNLYIRRTIKGNCDLYVSRFINGAWQKPEPLSEINTEFNETGLAMTDDAKTIYFASDRNRKAGRSDIYKSTITAKGTWSKPERLRSNINTRYNEYSPFVTPDGKTLYFSTNGSSHKGLGGYDIYTSQEIGENIWSNPKNLGFPINTTRADLNYYVVGNIRYLSRMTDDQSFDIFMVEDAPIVQAPEPVLASSTSTPVNGMLNSTVVADSLLKKNKKDSLGNVIPMQGQAVATINEKKVIIDTVRSSAFQLPKPIIQVAAPTTPTPPNVLRDWAKDGGKEKTTNGGSNSGNTTASENNNVGNKTPEVAKGGNLNVNYDPLNTSGGVRFKVLYFGNNKHELNSDANKELDDLVTYLNAHPDQKVEIDGHADGVGKWEDNWQLAIYRARQVYNYLLEHHIAYNRMIYTSKGSAIPAASNETEETRQKTRRVEIYILK